jgi:hypothetical protein
MTWTLLESALVYAGFVGVLVGSACLVKPLTFLHLTTRLQGGLVLLAGLFVAAVCLLLPAGETRIEKIRTRLDEFAPAYQFNEFHSARIAASCARTYHAIKSTTADEILLFRTLTWIRRGGHSGPEGILNAPERQPLLDVATRTSFLLLAEDPGREILLGTLVAAPKETRLKANPTPQDFKLLDRPGFAKAMMNFRLEDAGPGACEVTTETRVYATGTSARRRFAVYWRVIYPGSSLIRVMWLRAIKRRAESPE